MIYVTGANGVLSTALKEELKDLAIYWTKEDLDISNEEQCKEKLKDLTADDWIINCAAITDVDWCELHPEESYLINVKGVKNITDNTDAHIIQISSASVFGEYGAISPDINFNKFSPLSEYSDQKLSAEFCLGDNEYILIRTCWLFSGEDNDKKFVRKIADQLKNKEKIKVARNVEGQIMYASDLAKFIKHCINNKLYGVWHAASHNTTNRLEIANYIQDELNNQGIVLTDDLIYTCELIDFNLPACRPHKEFILVDKTEKLTEWKFRSWQEMIDDFLDKFNNKQ